MSSSENQPSSPVTAERTPAPYRSQNPIAPLAPPAEGLYPQGHPPDDRGESALWRAFRSFRPAGWTIWHHLVVGRSLDQAEIDFAVAVPGRGVVLVEVKAGQMVRRDGLWWQNGVPLERQPGEQVERARRALLQTLRRRFPGVFFPEIAVALCFPETSGANYPQVAGLPILFHEDLMWFEAGGHARLMQAFTGRVYPADRSFLGALHAIWGPDWVPMPALSRAPQRAEVAWRQLTPEQLTVLTCLDDSRRLLIEGPPGSGKTILLMALAERLQSEGVQTLVLTFTRAIAAELARAGVRSVFPVREWALAQAQRAGLIAAEAPVESWTSADWGKMLTAVTALLEGGGGAQKWEVVLVDEYQDLGAADWALLEALVCGERRLWLFGDDAQRALWHAQGAEVPPALRPGGVFRLHAGLRCPAALLERARKVRDGARGASPVSATEDACLQRVIVPAGADDAARLAAIDSVVDGLLAEGVVAADDIAVLSCGSVATSRLRAIAAVGPRPVRRADDDPRPGDLLADTILRAKGLERPVVILTDLDLLSPANRARLLYVGLTRASWRCVVIGTAAELALLD